MSRAVPPRCVHTPTRGRRHRAPGPRREVQFAGGRPGLPGSASSTRARVSRNAPYGITATATPSSIASAISSSSGSSRSQRPPSRAADSTPGSIRRRGSEIRQQRGERGDLRLRRQIRRHRSRLRRFRPRRARARSSRPAAAGVAASKIACSPRDPLPRVVVVAVDLELTPPARHQQRGAQHHERARPLWPPPRSAGHPGGRRRSSRSRAAAAPARGAASTMRTPQARPRAIRVRDRPDRGPCGGCRRESSPRVPITLSSVRSPWIACTGRPAASGARAASAFAAARSTRPRSAGVGDGRCECRGLLVCDAHVPHLRAIETGMTEGRQRIHGSGGERAELGEHHRGEVPRIHQRLPRGELAAPHGESVPALGERTVETREHRRHPDPRVAVGVEGGMLRVAPPHHRTPRCRCAARSSRRPPP